jgi:hypothetical protein
VVVNDTKLNERRRRILIQFFRDREQQKVHIWTGHHSGARRALIDLANTLAKDSGDFAEYPI